MSRENSFSLVCPFCKEKAFGVKDGWAISDEAYRRRRYCHNCGKRWTTIELPLASMHAALDAGGTRQKKKFFQRLGVRRIPRSGVTEHKA